jgi:RNA polymerase sigma-70 factor, ECF subfamily
VTADRRQPEPTDTTSRCSRLYADHVGRVRTYLRRCGFAPADVDDLSQETFLRAFRSIDTFDSSRGSQAQWIGAIVRNVVRKRWAKRPNPTPFDPDLAEAVLEDHSVDDDSPATREELAALRLCIDAMPSDLARLVSLRYVEGLATRAISETEGIPEATVRLRLDEARAALGRCLKSKGIW